MDSGDYTYYAPEAQAVDSRYRPFAIYVNDDYRATSKLTVNMGLRWDYYPPFREAENRWSFLNTELMNPVTGTRGALEFAGNVAPGDSCDCATPVRSYLENFAGHSDSSATTANYASISAARFQTSSTN